MPNEFDIIQQYFGAHNHKRSDVVLGIGDDAACVTVPAGKQLLITTDTLVAGVHFPMQTHAFDIGYKVLAVNLSDLAAMGAAPCWATLSVTLPAFDETWLSQFSEGFFNLLDQYNMQLIGGDLTKGPLAVSVQAHGLSDSASVVKRSTAKPGDSVYVTGTLGDAGLALRVLNNDVHLSDNHRKTVLQKLNRPHPKVKQGMQLSGVVSSMIDISDGLVADLGHILTASKVGAKVFCNKVLLSDPLLNAYPLNEAYKLAFTAGDD